MLIDSEVPEPHASLDVGTRCSAPARIEFRVGDKLSQRALSQARAELTLKRAFILGSCWSGIAVD